MKNQRGKTRSHSSESPEAPPQSMLGEEDPESALDLYLPVNLPVT